ncbi:MAG: histidine kinase [Gammaproteobacteria bacterium]|jgi:two-component system sensor histidine kinase AlgZ
MVLAVVLVSELLAFAFTLVRSSGAGFLTELARISMLMQWLGLTSAALLCMLRAPLARASTGITTSIVLGVVLLNILILSIAMIWAGRWLGGGDTLQMFPSETWLFVLRNLVIGLIVTALLLRYFFVSHQWRLHVEAEARSRIDALQARIRPHFLFNSMNTIASLTRSDPDQAEQAVEDLADLFRATLNDAGRLLTLKEEFELTRIYQRIEMLRLGDRLQVDWDVGELPMRARLPGLTIQPLLENAIYHGIEPLDDGGVVTIAGSLRNDEVEIRVTNPIGRSAQGQTRQGHRIAVQNIRERLLLAFEGRGALDIDQSDGTYQVTVRFPVS